MITATRPYTAQNRQKQSFESKIPEKFLKGCREGHCGYMNRIMDGFPHDYTIEENQDAIRKVIEDPKTKMNIALRQIGKCFGVLKD